jgi:hypothetical protein
MPASWMEWAPPPLPLLHGPGASDARPAPAGACPTRAAPNPASSLACLGAATPCPPPLSMRAHIGATPHLDPSGLRAPGRRPAALGSCGRGSAGRRALGGGQTEGGVGSAVYSPGKAKRCGRRKGVACQSWVLRPQKAAFRGALAARAGERPRGWEERCGWSLGTEGVRRMGLMQPRRRTRGRAAPGCWVARARGVHSRTGFPGPRRAARLRWPDQVTSQRLRKVSPSPKGGGLSATLGCVSA